MYEADPVPEVVLAEWARLNPDLVRACFVRMRTRWTEDVPFLPGWKPRGGRKRTKSPSRSRPGVEKKRKRSRSTARVVDGLPGVEAYASISSQPNPGLPGIRYRTEVLHNRPYQDEEKELVESGSGPSKGKDLRAGLKSRRILARPAKKSSWSLRVLSYDEIIEGPPRVENGYEDLDSVFEIPSEVEDFDI